MTVTDDADNGLTTLLLLQSLGGGQVANVNMLLWA